MRPTYAALEVGDRVQVYDGCGPPYSGTVADKIASGLAGTILIRRGQGGSNRFKYVSVRAIWRKLK